MALKLDKISLFIVLGLILIGLIFPTKYFWSPIKGAAGVILSPVQIVLRKGSLAIFDFLNTLGQIKKLAQENDQLQRENSQLLTENAKLIEAQKENDLLRQELGFVKKNPDLSLLAGQIIALEPSGLQQYVTINVGQKDGVRENMAVVISGFLVGVVKEVFYNEAKVILITNPNSVVNAMIQATRANGLVEGELGYGLILGKVAQETKINIGDVVITSGLGGKIPKGLIIGQVTEIISQQSQLFQSARLRPAADFSKLEMVFIITNF